VSGREISLARLPLHYIVSIGEESCWKYSRYFPWRTME